MQGANDATRVMALVLGLAAGGGAAAGCGHATRTDAQSAGTKVSEAQPSPSPAPKLTRTVSTENGTPIATGPVGLLRPDALERIQEKLASAGKLGKSHATGALDAATRQALREFQSANQLPATGVPDDATVAKLGLAPADIFRSAARK